MGRLKIGRRRIGVAAVVLALCACVARLAGAQAQQGTAPQGKQAGAVKVAPSTTALPAVAAAPPPQGPTGRPRIGLALAGGSAYALSEVGVLQWFEEHHIPVDMIAGTSMGSLVGALYATGHTINQMKAVTNTAVFDQVFSIGTSYKDLSFRRREESRELPNAVQIGLRHGVSIRNSVLTDQGLNAFLDREFYAYDDRSEFNALPIPLRTVATDLNDAKSVTFARGSIPDAVRASVSIPGVYQPVEIDGHEYVDGGVLRNLPTQTVREMGADVILAVDMEISPASQSEFSSILGVLTRSFSVAIAANEAESRGLAAVVVAPDLGGFSGTDYTRSAELVNLGYNAAEKQRAALLKYSVSDAQWAEYVRGRASRVRSAAGNVLRVKVSAPNRGATEEVEHRFWPLVDQPMNTAAIESLLEDIRSDGRYAADYKVTYESSESNRPTIFVTVMDKTTGPPFLELGANLLAETGIGPRATVEGVLLDQDLGGYGSELRTDIKAGWMTQISSEYYWRIPGLSGGQSGPARLPSDVFLAPHADLLREPFYIYRNQVRLSERQLQTVGGGLDLGWSNQRNQELRAGWEMENVRWQTDVGSNSDGLPDVFGSVQRARLRYVYDTQDRALVPRFGVHLVASAGYLFNAAGSENAPEFKTEASVAHALNFGFDTKRIADAAKHGRVVDGDNRQNVAVFALEAGTLLGRSVAQPFRFTLGGPLRLTASAMDEYRGTDYFLLEPAYLRRIASLPQPLGQNIYLGMGYEAGQMRAPDARMVTRQDVYFGVVAETPLGVLTFAPAIGDDGHRKLVFTLGKLF
jgi:NTE family protein